ERHVPNHVKKDFRARLDFFVHSVREALVTGGFAGRQVILALPAASMFIGHLRLAKMEGQTLTQSLAWEIRGKIPIEPAQAVLRHLIAGEVFVDQEPRDEIIVLASRKEVVDGLLESAKKARLDVVGMNVEMGAIVDCFSNVYRRKTDADATNCFVEIGSIGTRVIVSRGGHILFARGIPVGASELDTTIAKELRMDLEAAAARRRQLAAKTADEPALVAAGAEVGAAFGEERRRDLRDADDDPANHEINGVYATVAEKLVEELTLCRRYYESTFPGRQVDRLIFVGGGASDRKLCQEIARGMGLPAQVGDPLVRVEGRHLLDGEGKKPHPAWAVAVGLSAGGVT
ncbi:MAG TPA: pilus assembly protein PilM, partial [Tepidisphaeraceae bacterium]|nr:pilus assembly protein PilM [Tepidisphaeraceae bacterium]